MYASSLGAPAALFLNLGLSMALTWLDICSGCQALALAPWRCLWLRLTLAQTAWLHRATFAALLQLLFELRGFADLSSVSYGSCSGASLDKLH